MQAQRRPPRNERSQTTHDRTGGGMTGAATPLTIWAAAVLLGRIGAGDDDIEDERHILRGIE
ncbi:hypothetical protein ACN263_08830 [Micromonospora sp. WMMD729]|uniref:hypothetical protein n=1 Tax=Micromonospora sp. WMMD729 TaxID=3404127 RepID=UPI003BF48113